MTVLLIAGFSAGRAEVNRIVLRVNDRISTLHDYEKRRLDRIAAVQAADMPAGEKGELIAEAGETTMSEIFEELLLLSRADQIGLVASDEAVDRAMERTKANFGIETDEQMETALRSSGMTEEGFREQLRRNQTVQEVIGREVQSRIELEEEDLRRYYREHADSFELPEQLKLREIVILDSSDLDESARLQTALEIREEVISGKALEDLGPIYADRGLTSPAIDLGWIERGDLNEELEDAVWDLETGAISEAIPARGGLHLIELVERKEARTRPFDEVADEIDARERNRLFAEVYDDYLDELEEEAYIVVDTPPDAAGFRTGLGRKERKMDPLTELFARGAIQGADESQPEAPAEGAPADG